ncbi:MAG TPA: FtsX-like permease family protein [Blastocatellia bacterium]|nr:FtsX-like permease family protein [Blastocatellia bacterium]
MKAYSRLFKQFILRGLARERARSGITVLGISLGVGVLIAIRLANLSALESFRAATASVAGETSIQITGAAGRFDERLLKDLGWLRQYGRVSPVVEGYAMLGGTGSGSQSRGEFLQVMGVDVLSDRALRSYRLLRLSDDAGEPNLREFLLLLADPRAIVLTEKFARKHGLRIGGTVPLVIGKERREYTVRGLLLDEGPARALDGSFALMDIAAAQTAFNRIGLLDRVDIKLRGDGAVDTAEAEIAARLPGALKVTRPEATYGQVEKMIAAFHFNLGALGSIALLVGLFLIYNTISISVITRREEVGTLRAIGAGRPMVLALFLGEAILLTIAGTVIGLGFGRLMADAAVRATATTVEVFYIANAAAESVALHSLGWAEVALAFAVALPLALVAAMVPALEASRVRPVEAMRGAEKIAKGFRPSVRLLIISGALIAAGCVLSLPDAVGGLPIFAYLAALSLMFGGAFLVPNALWLACLAGGGFIGRILPGLNVEARLAGANLRGAISRVSISVAALAVSLSMMVSISIMIGSFRETVSYWVDQTLKADIYARPLMRAAASDEGEVDPEALARIKAEPEVSAVDAFTSRQVEYQGYPISLGAGDFQVLLEYGSLLYKSPGDAREMIRAAIDRDMVVVSESFSLRFRKRPGDVIDLPTPAGGKPFGIAAVYYDYSNNRGAAVMDHRTYARHFGQAKPNSVSIYLRPGADAEEVKERLAGATGDRFQMIFTTNQTIRREVIRIFDSTFSITYALEVIAILVAGLGVISTLIALILERRAEIAVLGFLGATRAQIRRMIVIEAVLIGAVSQAIGILIGVMMSLVLIYVINVQSFGWTIQFHFPSGFLIQSTLLILGVTAVAGLYPATRAAKIEAVRFAREE